MGSRRKMIFFLFLVFSCTRIAFSQDTYFVTFVKGEIKRSNSTKIKVGDKLLSQEKVIFSQKDGRLILLHPQKGRFIIEPLHTQPEPTGEYFVYVQNNLIPNNQTVKLSSRGGGGDLDEFFTVNTSISKSLLFIGDTRVSLDNSKYRIKDPGNDFFFLQYSPAAGKSSTNKLIVLHDSLQLNRSDFVFNGKAPADTEEVKLGFIQNYATEKKVTKISSFIPVFMSLEDCRNILKTIRQTLGNNRGKVIEEAMIELSYNYGKTDRDILGDIYDEL
jgi:hypothetical protein